MKIDIGIKEQDRGEIAQGLSRLLADTYTLYLKTHNSGGRAGGGRVYGAVGVSIGGSRE